MFIEPYQFYFSFFFEEYFKIEIAALPLCFHSIQAESEKQKQKTRSQVKLNSFAQLIE